MGNMITLRKNNIIKKSRKNKTKKAVLVGLNYTGTSAELHGCINDITRMKQTLITNYEYINVRTYTDNDNVNILQILDNLVTSPEQIKFFQYSGHGTQVIDTNGDESDGMDEALYSINDTIITDDDINNVVSKLGIDKTLVMVIDACHSGSMIDLPYQLINGRVVKINNNEILGNIISISGCKDDQESMDVNNGISYGAMSTALNKVLSKCLSTRLTWKQLVHRINTELKTNKYAQIPILSVSRPELINQKINM